MKYFYLIAAFALFSIFCHATPRVDSAIANGNWKTASTWYNNQIPADGDTVVVPANRNVIISSSESLNNVFIKVRGTLQITGLLVSLTLDQTSSIVVYTNGSITGGLFNWIGLGTSGIYYGITGALTGPKYANASTGNNGFMPFNNITIPVSTGILPVKFTAFNVAKRTNDVLLQWNVENEVDVRSYEVQRSFDGKNWQSITSIYPSNTSTYAKAYAYADNSIISGSVYYRIRQVDNNGSFSLSIIKVLSLQPAITGKEVKILSMQNRVVLQFPQQVKGNVSVRFLAPGGQVIAEQTLNAPAGQVILNQNASLHGNYFVSVTNGSSLNMTTQVIL